MAINKNLETRVLQAKWTDGDSNVTVQEFKNISESATAEKMNDFFNCISALTTDTLSYKGYEDTSDVAED